VDITKLTGISDANNLPEGVASQQEAKLFTAIVMVLKEPDLFRPQAVGSDRYHRMGHNFGESRAGSDRKRRRREGQGSQSDDEQASPPL
jgi:hypothetical protein